MSLRPLCWYPVMLLTSFLLLMRSAFCTGLWLSKDGKRCLRIMRKSRSSLRTQKNVWIWIRWMDKSACRQWRRLRLEMEIGNCWPACALSCLHEAFREKCISPLVSKRFFANYRWFWDFFVSNCDFFSTTMSQRLSTRIVGGKWSISTEKYFPQTSMAFDPRALDFVQWKFFLAVVEREGLQMKESKSKENDYKKVK